LKISNFKALSDPGAVISMVVGLTILAAILVDQFPVIIAAFVNLSGISGFQFASFFETDGVAALILSVVVLIGVFGFLGFKIMTGSKR